MNQKLYSTLKRRLSTRSNQFSKARHTYLDRKTRENADAMVTAAKHLQKEAAYGLAQFAEHGHPDQWHRWENAKDDATIAMRHAEVTCFR